MRRAATTAARLAAGVGLDVQVAAVAFAATALLFGAGAYQLGFYSDDAGFLETLPGEGVVSTLRSASAYVPGRNLHIIWQQLIFVLGGHGPGDLGMLHVIQSCLDGICVALFYLVLRKLRLSPFWSVVGAAILAVYPNHGETHFWLSSAPMNVMSTLWFLAFAYAAAAAGERTAKSGRREPVWLLALGFVFFGLALFTYDQTFFVLLFVLAVRAGQLFRRRVSLDVPLIGASSCYVGLILTYAALKRHPQSGPTLTHFSVSHVWSNLELSISTTFGGFFRSQLDFLLRTSTTQDREIAWAEALVFVLGCGAIIARDLFARRSAAAPSGSARDSGLSRSLGLVAAGVACFFLAYLPAYLWYISSRHNFLPTTGLALGIAAAGSAVTAGLAKHAHRAVPVLFGTAVSIMMAFFVARFVQADLSEKHYWQESYQLRRNLYAQLVARHLLANKTAIVFDGFPSSLGPAPYFGQENQFAVDYLHAGQVSLDESSVSALRSRRGYYLYTEIDRYGPMPARFLPAGAVTDVVYLSESSSSVRFATSNRRYSVDHFYRVQSTALRRVAGAGRPELRSAVLETGARETALMLHVASGNLRLEPGQELAAVLFRANGTPWTTVNAYNEPMVIPIGLTQDHRLAPVIRFRVDLLGLAPADASGFSRVSLYVLSGDLPRLLATTNIVH